MAWRKGKKGEAASVAPSGPVEVDQPELRGQDKRGNVRPADDRYLSSADKKKRDKYVAEQTDAQQKVAQEIVAAVRTEPLQEELPNG